ncbi:MAG: translation initiation factor IF-2 subunit beta [Candidatus Micrarchaeota archaeon]|nr:translation initiation factor IF-2 subunit beta [Candidatus Micrarchaeota archaeon]
MSEQSYTELLDRAFSKLPKLSAEKSDFVIPKVESITEGNKTIIRNIMAIADAARRKAGDIARYVSKELSIPVNVEDTRLIINGKFPQDDLNKRILKYFEVYVVCKECHKPDTHLENAEKGMYLVCEACGARYWVKNY